MMAAPRLRKPPVSLRCCLPLLCLAAPSAFATSLDLPALIECRQGVAEQAALAPLLADPLKAVAQGLQPLPQGNQFMSEYRLAQPISVFGARTERVAVAGPASWPSSTRPIRARWPGSWGWRPATTRTASSWPAASWSAAT
jgi:hypothetical protein